MPPEISIKKVKVWAEAFVKSPPVAGPMGQLRGIFPPNAQIVIVGGALRNLIIEKIHGKAPVTRDVDVFIGRVDPALPLKDLFGGHRFESTELGGIRWYPEDSLYSFDICLIPHFIVLKKYDLEADVQTLLTVLDFDVNAVIYDPDKNFLYENRCIEAIICRTMDFNTPLFGDKDLLIYRILMIRHKIDFTLSYAIFHYLKSSVEMEAMQHVQSILVGIAGKSDAGIILKTFDRICSFPDYHTYVMNLPLLH